MTYLIIPVANLNQTMIDDCVETAADTLRRNNDNTSCILKYEGAKPASVDGYTEYTHEEILTEMEKAEWQPEEV